jgi:hypothetical protein
MVKSNSIDLARRVLLTAALGVLALGAGLIMTRPAAAQGAPNEEAPLLSPDALEELVGPIALYPDDLVGIVLPAATYPLQVVQAARFLDERASDNALTPDEDWDDSVVALLNYPDVVKLMNDDLDWTWELGEAVLNQRAEVLDAIQEFRDRAYAAGNLRSDDRQVVSNDGGVIEIAPADPEVIYIPYYEPERVVVYQSRPVFHYHPWAYPVYYYPYPAGYAFHSGYFWGVTSAFTIGWHSHFLHVHHHGFHGHPYYGRYYYDPFYVRRGININVNINRGNVWEPRYHRAARPFARSTGRRVAETLPSNTGAREQGHYRSRSGAPESRTFARPERERSAMSPNSNANSNAGRRNPSVERQQRAVAGRTPETAPQATIRARTQPRLEPSRASGATVRQQSQAAPSQAAPSRVVPSRVVPSRVVPPQAAPSQAAPRQRTGGGMSQALERAQPRYNNANRTSPNTAAAARAQVSRNTQSASRPSGEPASGQRGYRSETSAPNNSTQRATARGNQSSPQRGTRSSGRQSTR